MDNQIGKVIKSYELEGLIGTGGFGAVYRAKQASVAREVAIKIIWPAFANHPNFIRRFEAEAQLVAGLEHPHIVPLYDYWRDSDGAYIVMRYLRGGHLRGMMNGRAWTVKEVNHVLENVAAALALAHRYGVVHRDIKPENILLDEDGNAYLADFGIAQILSNAKDAEDDFAGMGSPAYAAPEQVNGGLTSSQSDIYSLGVVLFELLTGEHPFPDLADLSMSQVISVRATSPLPPLISRRVDMTPALNDVIQRATALDPKMRYPDALSLSYAFREAAGQGVSSVNTPTKRMLSNEVIPNPYKGLRAFQESDASVFFGREALVRRLLNRLWENEDYNRFLAVVGPSGSGKSSVVQAGLMPTLRQGALPGSEKWFYSEITPGGQPFQELANVVQSLAVTPPDNLLARLKADEGAFSAMVNAILPNDNSEVFLLIDQFEEVFTLVTDEDETTRFIGCLYHAVTDPKSRIRVVVTIRADFYDRPLLQPRISDLVRERTEVVVPLSPVELERVIVEPARKVGVTVDDGLVASIIAEVQEQPGALPLLQYALSELFEKREGMAITAQAYRAVGGVRGALARRADEIYNRLEKAHQEAMRQLFLRLITLGEGTEDTRRRALLSEVTAIRESGDAQDDVAVMQTVVDTLGRARLLTFDRDPITRTPTVEVTHEAIIREWAKLRLWLDESRNDVRLQRALSVLAQEWYNANRDPSFLMRGIRLQQYERWLQSTNLALTQQEKTYLEFSIAARKQFEDQEVARQQRERALEQRSIRFLRLLVAGLVVLVVGAIVLTGFALRESQRAEESAKVAQASANLSRSVAFASSAQNALSNNDGDLAIVLALQANNLPNPPVDARSTLAEVAITRGTQKVLNGHLADVTGVAISPDMTLIASCSKDATVRLWDAKTGLLRFNMSGHGGDVDSVSFSPDNRLLVSAGSDFVSIIWDTATGEEVRRLVGHTAPVRRAMFTPDGQTIITVANDNLVILWDVATGREKMRFLGHSASVSALDISGDGTMALTGSLDGKLLFWNTATGAIVNDFVGHTTTLTDVDINADGTKAVSASRDGTIIIWDLTSGQEMMRFVGAIKEPRAVAFTPDSKYVLSGTIDGAVQFWSTATGLEVDHLTGHRDAVTTLAVSVDGRVAVTGSQDTTIRLWNVGNPGQLAQLGAYGGRVSEMTRGKVTGNLYSGSADGTLRVWSPDNILLNTFTFTDFPILALAVSADEQKALIGSKDGVLYQIDLNSGAQVTQLQGHSGNVLSAEFLPNGVQALTTSQDGEVILWNVDNGLIETRYTVEDKGSVNSLALLPNGTQFAVSVGDNTLRLYNLDDANPIRTFTGHTGTIYSLASSPDGALLASGGRDGFAIIWDVATGQERGRLTVGTDAVWSVAFNVAGDKLITGTASGAIAVWDVTGADLLQRFTADDTVFSLAFAADGTSAFSGQGTGTIDEWLVFNNDDAVVWTQTHRYVRTLDCFEREKFRVEPYCAPNTPANGS